MNGSARQISAPTNTPRAPYAAPQTASAVQATAAAPLSSPALPSSLAPFVPPRFRDWAPAAPTPVRNNVVAAREPWESPLLNAVDTSVLQADKSLPWIEAFVQDDDMHSEPEVMSPLLLASSNAEDIEETSVEDSWLMGEAGKRLTELTQSLSSLDASRAAQAALDEKSATVELDQPAALPMWGDDDWMDIMPTYTSPSSTSMVPQHSRLTALDQAPVEEEYFDEPTSLEAAAAEAIKMQQHHSDVAANALESVARRIRAGEMAIPEFDADMSEGGRAVRRVGIAAAFRAVMTESAPLFTRHYVVEGRVQGVGFRWFTRERARRFGLSGWVQNREDGSVELIVKGCAELLDRLVNELAIGPKGSSVSGVRELENPADDELPFPFVIHR